MAAVEKSTDKQPDRGKDGKFEKGNTLGNRFSSDNQPENQPGRPKTKTLTDALLAHLTKKATTFPFTEKAARKMKMDPEEATCIEVLMATTFLHGMKGKGDILKEIWARVEGAIPKHLTLGADDPVLKYMEDMENATAGAPPPEESQEDAEQPAEPEDADAVTE